MCKWDDRFCTKGAPPIEPSLYIADTAESQPLPDIEESLTDLFSKRATSWLWHSRQASARWQTTSLNMQSKGIRPSFNHLIAHRFHQHCPVNLERCWPKQPQALCSFTRQRLVAQPLMSLLVLCLSKLIFYQLCDWGIPRSQCTQAANSVASASEALQCALCCHHWSTNCSNRVADSVWPATRSPVVRKVSWNFVSIGCRE